MAQRAIREFDAKNMLSKNWNEFVKDSFTASIRLAQVGPETNLDDLPNKVEWLRSEKLVVKPDMIMGKRGKHGLMLLNAGWDEAKTWLNENRGNDATIGEVTGEMTHFLIEPFAEVDKEYYVAVSSKRDGDEILFSTEGGVDIEQKMKEGKVVEIMVPTLSSIDDVDVAARKL